MNKHVTFRYHNVCLGIDKQRQIKFCKLRLWLLLNESLLLAPSTLFQGFLLFFLFSDWLMSNHLKSQIECGFLDIFSRHICCTVKNNTNIMQQVLARKIFRKPSSKLLRRLLIRGTNSCVFFTQPVLALHLRYSTKTRCYSAGTRIHPG